MVFCLPTDSPTVYLGSPAFSVQGRDSLLATTPNQDEELRIARIMRYLMLDESANASSLVANFYSEMYFLAGDQDAYGGYTNEDILGENFNEDTLPSYQERLPRWEGDVYPEISHNNFDNTFYPDKDAKEKRKTVNPGLNPWIKSDIAALYSVAENWKKSYEENNGTAEYIIRRFGVTLSGGVVQYPGSLSSGSSESSRYDWWTQRALKRPTSPLLLLPPKLDETGAAYVVTLAATTSGTRGGDTATAVLAADMSLGYWQKLVLSMHPACDTTGLHLTTSGIGVRCFLVDNSGFLVVHPGVLHPPPPAATHTSNTMHITVQEPLLSMTLLDAGSSGGEQQQLLWKEVCGEWWRGRSQRKYKLNLKPGQLVTSQHASTKVRELLLIFIKIYITFKYTSYILFAYLRSHNIL